MGETANHAGRLTPPQKPERVFEAALRDLRQRVDDGRGDQIDAARIESLAVAIADTLDSRKAGPGMQDVVPDKPGERILSGQYVSLLKLAVGKNRWQSAMGHTLGRMAEHLSAMRGDDETILQNHRQLVTIASLAAGGKLASRLPIPALRAAQGNIAFYMAFAPESWSAVAAGFDRAVRGNAAWTAALLRAVPEKDGFESVRHRKESMPRAKPVVPGVTAPHLYINGHIGAADVGPRLDQCLKNPEGLREAVQLARRIAGHQGLREQLVPHEPDMARRLIRAVRRGDPRQAGPILNDFAHAMPDTFRAMPPRRVKAVLGALPKDQAIRFAAIFPRAKASAAVRETMIEAEAREAATKARETLRKCRPTEGYRRVIDQFTAMKDAKARRRGLKPVLPDLVGYVFRDARHDPERAMNQLTRLIRLAGSPIRDALTPGQIAQYETFAHKTGRTKTLKPLIDKLSKQPRESILPTLAALLSSRTAHTASRDLPTL